MELDQQARVLELFTVLGALETQDEFRLGNGWGGRLVLGLKLDSAGAALAMAANLAGAVSLSVEPESALCRAALRSGACDFAVNSVDEALRVLKNEVRRKQPLSVALEAPLEPAMRELLQRGVRPDLFAASTRPELPWLEEVIASFVRQSVLLVDFARQPPETPHRVLDGPAILRRYLALHHLRLGDFAFATAAELRLLDLHAARLLAEDAVRRRWVVGAPRLFHRQRPLRRLIYLTLEESSRLAEAMAT